MKNHSICSILVSFIFATLSLNAFSAPIKIGLNWKAEPEFGGFYAAQENGTYKKNNVDVEVVEGGAGTPVIQMVAAGKIEFGTVSGDELVIARSMGQDLVAVFAVYQKAPYILMARASKNFKKLDDLFKSNVTLSIAQGLPVTSFLEKKYGFKTVKVVPYNGGISNYLADENFAQQGFAASEPRLAFAKGVKTTSFVIADYGFNPYVTVVVTKASLLKEKPELVKNVVASIKQGWTDYLKNPESAHKVITKLNPTLDSKTLDAMLPIDKTFMESPATKKSGLGTMEASRWEATVKQLLDLGIIKKSVPAADLFKNL